MKGKKAAYCVTVYLREVNLQVVGCVPVFSIDFVMVLYKSPSRDDIQKVINLISPGTTVLFAEVYESSIDPDELPTM